MEGGSKVIAVTTRFVPFSPLPFFLPLALLYVAPPEIGKRCCAEALQALSPGSPLHILVVCTYLKPKAYTYLKQQLQPLQIFHQKI
jgi:hypothetical protein